MVNGKLDFLGRAAAVLALAALETSSALAHMPYILPSMFDAGTRQRITLEASFTEDVFRPEVAMKDAPFEVTGPDGVASRLAAPVVVGDRTLAEAPLPADGLYRLSSGQRAGRAGKMYKGAGGDWIMVGEGAAPPADAALVDVRSMTLADAYVLRGRPMGTAALRPRGTALEIHPLADPTTIAPGTAVPFEILYDGKPLAGREVTLFREAGIYDGRKQVGSVSSDRAGRVTLTPPDAGRYLILVRHRTAVAGGYASFTATVAFEAG